MRNEWNRSTEKCKCGLCGMKIINLTKEIIKILGVHISSNKKIQDDLNFTKINKNLCKVIQGSCTLVTIFFPDFSQKTYIFSDPPPQHIFSPD